MPFSQVHRRPKWAHHDCRHQVTGDRRRRLDPEEQDQHRRHQRATTGASHANQETDHGASEHNIRIDVHLYPLDDRLTRRTQDRQSSSSRRSHTEPPDEAPQGPSPILQRSTRSAGRRAKDGRVARTPTHQPPPDGSGIARYQPSPARHDDHPRDRRDNGKNFGGSRQRTPRTAEPLRSTATSLSATRYCQEKCRPERRCGSTLTEGTE